MVQETTGVGGGKFSVRWSWPSVNGEFNGRLRFDISFEIQVHGVVGLMFLKVDGGDIEFNVGRDKKGFFLTRHGCFLGSISTNKLLLEEFQLKNHGFGLMGNGCNEIWRRVSDVINDGFKLFSFVNWSVGNVRDCGVSG